MCQTRRVASLTAKNHLLILSSFIKFKRLESEVRIKSEHVTFHICDVLDEMRPPAWVERAGGGRHDARTLAVNSPDNYLLYSHIGAIRL